MVILVIADRPREARFRGLHAGFHRALVMGGELRKGSVQSVILWPTEAVCVLTTAKYTRHRAGRFHRNEKTGKGGITPDILIDVLKSRN